MNANGQRVRFVTPDDVAVSGLSREKMLDLRKSAADAGLPREQFVENAGRAAAEVVITRAGNGPLPRVLVIAGSTLKGAMGICAARHLANHDLDVALVVADPAMLDRVGVMQLAAYRDTSGGEVRYPTLRERAADIVLDALSCGATCPDARFADTIEWFNDVPSDVVVLDAPSGLDPSTGEAPEVAVIPHLTIAMGLPYAGLNEENSGEIVLADVGIPARAFHRAGIAYVSPFSRSFFVNVSRHASSYLEPLWTP